MANRIENSSAETLKLSQPLWQTVFVQLDPSDLEIASCVSKLWREVAQDNEVQKKVLEKENQKISFKIAQIVVQKFHIMLNEKFPLLMRSPTQTDWRANRLLVQELENVSPIKAEFFDDDQPIFRKLFFLLFNMKKFKAAAFFAYLDYFQESLKNLMGRVLSQDGEILVDENPFSEDLPELKDIERSATPRFPAQASQEHLEEENFFLQDSTMEEEKGFFHGAKTETQNMQQELEEESRNDLRQASNFASFYAAFSFFNFSCLNESDEFGEIPLHQAAISGDPELVRFLLFLKSPSSRQEQLVGDTPLHYIFYRNKNPYLACARIFLHWGVDVNSLNFLQETPLHIAADFGSLESVKMLLAFLANPNLVDRHKNTPLHRALLEIKESKKFARYQEVIQTLLKAGAKIDMVNEKGQTPIDIAREKNNPKLCSLLPEKKYN